MTGMPLSLPALLARLDGMIVRAETSLTPPRASVDPRAGAGLETGPVSDLLASMERHLELLHRNRKLLLRLEPEPCPPGR